MLLKINQTLSAKIIRREEIVSDDELLFVPPRRELDSTSTTAKVTLKEPWVHPDHASHVFTLPDCDHIEGGDSECETTENATQHFYHYDYVTDDRINDIYDYGVSSTTPNPEGLEEMDFVYGDIPVLNRKVGTGLEWDTNYKQRFVAGILKLSGGCYSTLVLIGSVIESLLIGI